MKSIYSIALIIFISFFSCKMTENEVEITTNQIANVLDYNFTPNNAFDKNGLMFSDQGAWFAYSFPDSFSNYGGFSGPFLMTQQNGVWSSKNLTQLVISVNNEEIVWDQHSSTSYNSHLEQTFSNEQLELKQKLVFGSGHTAYIQSILKNKTNKKIELKIHWQNQPLFTENLNLETIQNELIIHSDKSPATGHIIFPFDSQIHLDSKSYKSNETTIQLNSNKSTSFTLTQSFIFPEYSWEEEKNKIQNSTFDEIFKYRISEKETQLDSIFNNRKNQFSTQKYDVVLTKAHLTLQNNWRIPAGEIKHEGLFPSYHYKWFNGFWSWDSWKHAVGLAYYNTDLAKKQMKLMFEFQNEDGFVADCVYRDTSIETHNYRDTKPPLSVWAVSKIYEKDGDLEFVKYMYPKLKKYHEWWYNKRDHDQDGLCEYGSTDGSLIAAKWESGMDNAIRFDDSKILKNSEGAYSLNQESVDLNAYLYAEKLYLAQLAEILKNGDDKLYFEEAEELKKSIQQQFYDKNDGWFYDTNLEGDLFIKGEGSEGWTALWSNTATQEQAEAVKTRMMNPEKFFTKVPFQTMSADHPKFDPLKGYWRGPNWLDQSYFGTKALRNYGFNKEANKATVQILVGTEGMLDKGKAIRENYHPLTGQGLHAHNFSWSAAHVLMLLLEE